MGIRAYHLLGIMCGLLAGVACLGAGSAGAQDFPSRPIRLIVPQPTGTGGDIVARVMGDKFKQDLGMR